MATIPGCGSPVVEEGIHPNPYHLALGNGVVMCLLNMSLFEALVQSDAPDFDFDPQRADSLYRAADLS